MPDIIEALETERIKRKWKNYEMAQALGIDGAYWCRAKQGQGLGKSFLRGVLRRFPALTNEVVLYIREGS